MTETVEGRKSPLGGFVSDFKSLTPKQWLGIVAAIALALILEIYMGTNCMGFLVVAIVLYMIPHLLKVMSVKVKTVIGVVFIIVALLVGTFAFSGTIAHNESLIDSDNAQIKDVTYDEATDTIDFYVNPELEGDDWEVMVQHVPVVGISFGNANRAGDTATNTYLQPTDMTLGEDGWYHGTVQGMGLHEGSYYQIGIGIVESPAEDHSGTITASLVFWYDYGADVTTICLAGTAYTVAFAMILFFMILVFSALMRSSAEKTRAKMEAEGRLYPQGYGRCKQCGAMVLPGEVNCRKCGAYIDVPDELRVKKKDFFQCSECGAEVLSDATECPKCGAKFDEVQENVVVHADGSEDVSTESIVCPECGSTVPANADWCPKCGKMLKD